MCPPVSRKMVCPLSSYQFNGLIAEMVTSCNKLSGYSTGSSPPPMAARPTSITRRLKQFLFLSRTGNSSLADQEQTDYFSILCSGLVYFFCCSLDLDLDLYLIRFLVMSTKTWKIHKKTQFHHGDQKIFRRCLSYRLLFTPAPDWRLPTSFGFKKLQL